MLGTLNGALEVRGIKLPAEAIRAEAEGVNELRESMPVLTRIHLKYVLRVPAGSREVVERALARHQEKCPTAQSLRGAVEVGWQAEIAEEG
ncbi:MAG: OsmC family protein [Gemmatimonadetes bacterium]|nr:OsmC family protein [Gemmatimonadota bacterium]